MRVITSQKYSKRKMKIAAGDENIKDFMSQVDQLYRSMFNMPGGMPTQMKEQLAGQVRSGIKNTQIQPSGVASGGTGEQVEDVDDINDGSAISGGYQVPESEDALDQPGLSQLDEDIADPNTSTFDVRDDGSWGKGRSPAEVDNNLDYPSTADGSFVDDGTIPYDDLNDYSDINPEQNEEEIDPSPFAPVKYRPIVSSGEERKVVKSKRYSLKVAGRKRASENFVDKEFSKREYRRLFESIIRGRPGQSIPSGLATPQDLMRARAEIIGKDPSLSQSVKFDPSTMTVSIL